MTRRLPFNWPSIPGPVFDPENSLKQQEAEQAAELNRKQAWQTLKTAAAGVCRLALQLINHELSLISELSSVDGARLLLLARRRWHQQRCAY